MMHKMTMVSAGDREVLITRDFNAPRNLVWDAHTKPDLIKRWLTGPPGWSMTVCEMDMGVGGRYRWVWSNVDGRDMGMGGVHLEVAKPEKLVNTQLFDEDWTGGEAVGTLVLLEKNDKTLLHYTVRYASKEARDGALKSGMDQGMAYGYDRLEETLATLA